MDSTETGKTMDSSDKLTKQGVRDLNDYGPQKKKRTADALELGRANAAEAAAAYAAAAALAALELPEPEPAVETAVEPEADTQAQ